jgi:hypothetical protein
MPRRGSRRKKSRTHVVDPRDGGDGPRSFVMKRGEVRRSVWLDGSRRVTGYRNLNLPLHYSRLMLRLVSLWRTFEE